MNLQDRIYRALAKSSEPDPLVVARRLIPRLTPEQQREASYAGVELLTLEVLDEANGDPPGTWRKRLKGDGEPWPTASPAVRAGMSTARRTRQRISAAGDTA